MLTKSGTSPALQDIRIRLPELRAPVELQTRITDHLAHLQQLVERLKTFGMDEAVIDRQVIELFEVYETHLLRVISQYAHAPASRVDRLC